MSVPTDYESFLPENRRKSHENFAAGLALAKQLRAEGFESVLVKTFQFKQAPFETVIVSFWRKPGANTQMLWDDGKHVARWERRD